MLYYCIWILQAFSVTFSDAYHYSVAIATHLHMYVSITYPPLTVSSALCLCRQDH